MRRITGLILGLLVFAGAGNAFAQGTPIDCSVENCSRIKYGLGRLDDYRKDEYPPDNFRWATEDFGPHIPRCSGGPTPDKACSSDADCGAGGTCVFGASYYNARTGLNPNFGGDCGPDRTHSPTVGMVVLEELASCTPTGTGPTCVGGERPGTPCHLNAPTIVRQIECGTGICTDSGGGCRVQIPLDTADGGVTPPEETSELKIFTSVYQSRNPFTGNLYNLSAQTGNTFGGTSNDSDPLCPITNVRKRPSMATRYLLPESRRIALGLDPGATYLRWDSGNGLVDSPGCTETTCARANQATNFRYHTDDTRLCCAPNVPGDCSALLGQGSGEYPLLTNRACSTSTRPFTNDDNIIVDWIFVGGQNTAFFTDPDYVNPGQISGRCKVNTFQTCLRATADPAEAIGGWNPASPNAACAGNLNPFSCCTGAGAGTCASQVGVCAGLDADPDTPGLQPDTCDFSEPGSRVQVACARDSQGNTRRDCCGGAIYVLRGSPNSRCTMLPRMQYDGDPGKDCSVSNYGIDHRYDDDCDGVEDFADYCPFLTEWDQGVDSNGDCPGPACRGDECECADGIGGPFKPAGSLFRTGDGVVNVSDLVATNVAIFNPFDGTKRYLLNDANNDVDVTVSDIVATNIEIFRPDSSVCRQITPRQCGENVPQPCCGDGNLDFGEPCDDGNLAVSDGCNASCRVEPGWTCSGEPSVCTQIP